MTRSGRRAVCAALIALSCPAAAAAQDTLPPLPPRPHAPALLRFLSPLLVPKVLQDCFRLKEYIRSGEFASVRRAYGDLYAVDCVFDRAMSLCWENVYEALLVAAFAVMDHERFGIRLPLLGAVFWFPLTSEFAGDFHARVDALPSRLYADTPQGAEGDRDKLQHFFGAAFLTALTESTERTDLFGLMLEAGEELFVVGGVNDTRDVRANREGEKFGLDLLTDPGVRPSRYFSADSLR